jgi:hypothetical protein
MALADRDAIMVFIAQDNPTAAYSTPSRTAFRADGGHHSAVMADTVPR